MESGAARGQLETRQGPRSCMWVAWSEMSRLWSVADTRSVVLVYEYVFTSEQDRSVASY